MLFAFIGAAVGLETRRGARSWGALLSATVVFGYYVILTFSEFLAREHWLPSVIAPWIVNLLFAITAAALFVRADRIRDF
jgi:lipopolysaccharide export LptBFGC system permease protein LptF